MKKKRTPSSFSSRTLRFNDLQPGDLMVDWSDPPDVSLKAGWRNVLLVLSVVRMPEEDGDNVVRIVFDTDLGGYYRFTADRLVATGRWDVVRP